MRPATKLQALLALSSLHEKIRERRARERLGMQAGTADVWELEQFVLDEVLQLVSERALTLTGADGVAIALIEGNAFVCRASAGSIALDAGARLDPNSGFSGACLRTGGIVRCDDSEKDRRVDVQVCRRLGTRSIVAIPIASSRGTIGLLEAFSAEAYGFNDSDVRSLNLLAELILAALKPEEENRMAEISQRLVGGESATSPSADAGSAAATVSSEIDPRKIHESAVGESVVYNPATESAT
jgi:GAF domain-containing protein